MKKEERERERTVSYLYNRIKYGTFQYNHFIKVQHYVAVGCSNNSFKKSRKKDRNFYSFPKDDTLKPKWI